MTSDDRDLVSWRTGGEFTGTLGFSAPTEAETGNNYTLCLYDESGGSPTLLFDAVAPAGGTCGTEPCWKPTPNCSGAACGYTYNDKDSTPDGVRKLSALRSFAGPTTRTLFKLTARGANLSSRPNGLPPLPLPLPLRLISGGRCWEVEYTAASRNTAEVFKADVGP